MKFLLIAFLIVSSPAALATGYECTASDPQGAEELRAVGVPGLNPATGILALSTCADASLDYLEAICRAGRYEVQIGKNPAESLILIASRAEFGLRCQAKR